MILDVWTWSGLGLIGLPCWGLEAIRRVLGGGVGQPSHFIESHLPQADQGDYSFWSSWGKWVSIK